MYIDRIFLLILAGAYLLSPAVLTWWSHAGSAWYRPYLLWAAFIAIAFWLNKESPNDDL